MTTTTQPRPTANRIDSLDVLRGFAILGILVMNIQAFSMATSAYINPTVHGALTGAEWWVWLIAHVGFDGKFLALFSALFGAGLVLMADRAKKSGIRPWRRHLRRMAILGAIGFFHAYFIWYGDILLIYALVGLAAFAFRNLPPRRLLLAAALTYSVPILWGLVMTGLFHVMPEADYRELVATYWQPSAEYIAAETEAYRGGWLAQMTQRIPDAMTLHLLALPTEEGWRVLGLMLAGMAAYRTGLLTGDWSVQAYRRAAVLGVATGLPIVLAGVAFNTATGWEMRTSMYLGSLFNHIAVPFITLAWVCLALVLLKRDALPGLIQRLRSVGRGALSSYLLTSIICTAVFYGHGLGLFGQLDRVEQLLVVAVVWVLLLSIAPAWFRHYRMGPVEWLWRWGIYGRRPVLQVQTAT